MFDIADVPFAGVSDEEKQVYAATMKQTGSYQGYKPRQYWVRRILFFELSEGPFYHLLSISTMEFVTSLSIITVS
jgi:hypothetical protein